MNMKHHKIYIDDDLYREFKRVIYPVKLSQAFAFYIKTVIAAKTKPLNMVIDEALEDLTKPD